MRSPKSSRNKADSSKQPKDSKADINKAQKLALVYREASPEAARLGENLIKKLLQLGIRVYTGPGQKALRSAPLASSAELKKMNLVLALGGDGTYLRAARLLAGTPVPILGINLGSLGFLTPSKKQEALECTLRALEGKMSVVSRSTLMVHLKSRGAKAPKHWTALNDVVVERGSLSQIINLNVQSDGQFVSEIKADGLIVSTPTGSTAYNLAAGGPIAHPDARILVLTPISPHSLTSRVLVLPEDRSLSLKLKGIRSKAHLVIDGQIVATLGDRDSIRIRKNPSPHIMVRDPELGYFELLREKLKFGERS